MLRAWATGRSVKCFLHFYFSPSLLGNDESFQRSSPSRHPYLMGKWLKQSQKLNQSMKEMTLKLTQTLRLLLRLAWMRAWHLQAKRGSRLMWKKQRARWT